MQLLSQTAMKCYATVWHSCRSSLRGMVSATQPWLASICLGVAGGSLNAQTMVDGSAIITTRNGSVDALKLSTGEQLPSKIHTVLSPTGQTFTTQGDGRLFLALSNGVALAVDQDSQVQCLEYSQRPFDEIELRQGLEPSISTLQLNLTHGQIAIACNRLSPLSELRVQVPQGEIRLHKGTCLIQLDSTGLHIAAIEGNLTYYYPSGESREFISAPARVRLSDQSIARGQVAERASTESLDASKQQFCQAAQHASKRVSFKPNKATGLPPEPILIVTPDYFKPPAPRPYQFKDELSNETDFKLPPHRL